MTVCQRKYKWAHSVLSGSCSQACWCVCVWMEGLTDADLLGVEGLAAVVGWMREVRWWRVDYTGPSPPQDEGELTQHTWERAGRISMQCSSERGRCELADKRAWGWKEALEENKRRQSKHTVCALPGSHFHGCLDEKKWPWENLTSPHFWTGWCCLPFRINAAW